jgi:glycosyltransferase involved in cell wall biosynthesis
MGHSRSIDRAENMLWKSDMPFVSVIIPTHTGRRDYLRQAVESIFSQSYPKDRCELIIVDDASNDGTEQLAKELQKDSPLPIKYIRREKNAGSAVCRQMGLEMARGEIVSSLDSDCEAIPEWLEAGVGAFKEGVGLVQGMTLPHPGQSRKFWSRTMSVRSENFTYMTCNMFYLKNALIDAGGFRDSLGNFNHFTGANLGSEDLEAAWNMKRRGWKSVFSKDALVYHQVFERSIIKWLMEPTVFFLIPFFVRKHPGIREFFYKRFFFYKYTAVFDLAFAGLLCGMFVHPLFFVAGTPYTFLHLRHIVKNRPLKKYPQGLGKFLLQFCYDSIRFVTLVYGSVRYRSIVI